MPKAGLDGALGILIWSWDWTDFKALSNASHSVILRNFLPQWALRCSLSPWRVYVISDFSLLLLPPAGSANCPAAPYWGAAPGRSVLTAALPTCQQLCQQQRPRPRPRPRPSPSPSPRPHFLCCPPDSVEVSLGHGGRAGRVLSFLPLFSLLSPPGEL